MSIYLEEAKKNLRIVFTDYFKNTRTAFEKQDQLIVWITGFSITAIGLLVLNNDKLHFSYWVMKVSVLCFCFSILSAILYRILAIELLVRWQLLEVSMSMFTNPETPLEGSPGDRQEEINRFSKISGDFINNSIGLSPKTIEKNKNNPNKIFPLSRWATFFLNSFYIFFGAGVLVVALAF